MKYLGKRQTQWLHDTVNAVNATEIVHFKMVNFKLSEFYLNKNKIEKFYNNN